MKLVRLRAATLALLVALGCHAPGHSGGAPTSSDPLTAYYSPGGSLDDLPGPLPTNVVPYYGPMDRSADPVLAAADEKLIRDTTAEFGSARAASDAFCEVGREAYRNDDYAKAAKRFNQAWLIDPQNPEVPWGFACIYHDHKNAAEARRFIDDAVEKGLDSTTALADVGLMYAISTVREKDLDPTQVEALHRRSEQFVARSLETATTPVDRQYAFDSWVVVLLCRGDFAGARAKAAELRAEGMSLSRSTRQLLDSAPATDG